MELNNASSNSIRPTRPSLNQITTNKQEKPPIFLHRGNVDKKQNNNYNKDENVDDDRYQRKNIDYGRNNDRRNESDSRSRSHHHYHSPKHHHSHYYSSNSHHSFHSSKSRKSQSRSRSNHRRNRYHSNSSHSHHSSSQIIQKQPQQEKQYKQRNEKPNSNFHHKYIDSHSKSHSPSHISISSSSSSSFSSSSPSHSPKRSKEKDEKRLQQPPKLNKDIEHNPNTPRDSKLTNILSSAIPLPSPPRSPIIIPAFQTANKSKNPSIIKSIHEIVENMRNNKTVEKALSNCGIENGVIVKSQNHYKNGITVDDNPYFGFSKMKNLKYYYENKDESYNKDLGNDIYFNNPYSLDNMIRFYGIYPNKSLINTDTFEEKFYFDHMRESQNLKWAKERNNLYYFILIERY